MGVKMEVALVAPGAYLLVDDRVHLINIGSHRVNLEGGLHDAAMELVLVEITHQQAAGEEVAERRVVAQARSLSSMSCWMYSGPSATTNFWKVRDAL